MLNDLKDWAIEKKDETVQRGLRSHPKFGRRHNGVVGYCMDRNRCRCRPNGHWRSFEGMMFFRRNEKCMRGWPIAPCVRVVKLQRPRQKTAEFGLRSA